MPETPSNNTTSSIEQQRIKEIENRWYTLEKDKLWWDILTKDVSKNFSIFQRNLIEQKFWKDFLHVEIKLQLDKKLSTDQLNKLAVDIDEIVKNANWWTLSSDEGFWNKHLKWTSKVAEGQKDVRSNRESWLNRLRWGIWSLDQITSVTGASDKEILQFLQEIVNKDNEIKEFLEKEWKDVSSNTQNELEELKKVV